jgi:hypothetical protein
MKKTLLILSLVSISVLAFSQDDNSVGLKAGVNIATIGGDAAGIESKIGFHLGIFGIIKPAKGFGVQPEFVFSRQGAQASSNSDVKINYDYINVPVMFNFYPTENFYLQAGPQLGFLASAKVKFEDESEDLADQLNKVDFAMGFGLGFDLESMIIGFRYNAGLNSTAKDVPSDESYPNQVIQFSIGVKFN